MKVCVLILALCAAYSTYVPAASSDDFRAPAAKDWPMVGGNWSNTRYSSLASIDRVNVAKLGMAWVSAPFDEGGGSRVTPVVKDGLMFVTDWNGGLNVLQYEGF